MTSDWRQYCVVRINYYYSWRRLLVNASIDILIIVACYWLCVLLQSILYLTISIIQYDHWRNGQWLLYYSDSNDVSPIIKPYCVSIVSIVSMSVNVVYCVLCDARRARYNIYSSRVLSAWRAVLVFAWRSLRSTFDVLRTFSFADASNAPGVDSTAW